MKSSWLGLALAVCLGCTDPPRRWFDADCGAASACSAGLCLQGHCARPCSVGTDCGDGLCFKNLCVPVDAACKLGKCEDQNACTVDECNVNTGECRYTGASACQLDACHVGTECVACTPEDHCAGALNGWQCRGAPKCDDGDPATTDSCSPSDASCSNVKN